MFGRNKKREHSTNQTSSRNRNIVGRKIRVEKLQDRKLMAADFGGFGSVYGPVMPQMNPVAAQVSTTNATQGQMNAQSSLETSTVGLGVRFDLNDYGQLNVNGTAFHDVVNLDYNSETSRIDIFAETFNNAGEVIGRVTGSILHDDVNNVNAQLFSGNDELNANVFYIPVYANGGAGHDKLSGSYGSNTLDGGSGNDTLKGSVAADTLNGGSGNDRIEGGVGNDTLRGGVGNDIILGGFGDDNIYGEDGMDRLYGDGMFAETQFDGHDNIWGGDDRDTIKGNGGWDEIWGGDGNDWLFGGSGTDTINGGKGFDFLSGGSERDILSGGDDRDTMYGNGGDDLLLGGDDSDHMHGGDGNDTLYGQGGADYLYGGANNDYLDGGNGSRDHLWGESGRDTFIRHKHVWTPNDPDVFEDLQSYDNVVNKWFFDI